MARQATNGSVGQQALALLRTLTVYTLVIAVPVIGYYYAVVERQAQARAALALHALKRIQSEIDTRLERLDGLLAAPAQGDGRADDPMQGGAPSARVRYAELGVEFDAAVCADPAGGRLPPRELLQRAGQAVVCARGPGNRLLVPAERLLDAPSALARFERVLLADASGAVLASATPPVSGDPERVSHRPVPAMLAPVSIRPYLAEATRQRLAELSGQPAKDVKTDAGTELALGEPADLAAEIAGERYRIYLVPFSTERELLRDGKPLPVLYLVGIARQSALAEATAALGVEGLWYLIAALLLMLAAWPLLRVLLLSEREAVSRPALALTVVSVIFVPALLTLLLVGALARGDALARWDARARAHATAIAGELGTQVGTLLDTIDRHGPALAAGGPVASDDRLLQCTGFAIDTTAASTCELKQDNPAYCHVAGAGDAMADSRAPAAFDSLFLTDGDGAISVHPHLTTGGCQPRNVRISLASREYYTALSRGNGWPLPADHAVGTGVVAGGGSYFAQRIYSRADGTRTLVVAVPRRGPPPERRFLGVYGAVSTTRALSAAVTPPLLGFAVVDRLSGTVVFHSDDDSSLHENFYREIGDDGDLAAALRAGSAARVADHYRGRAHHFAVEPLPALPWLVVSWYAVGDVTTPPATAALIAAFEMLGLIGTLLVVGLVLLLVLVPVSRAIGWRTEVWQWLWPQWRLRAVYPPLALLFLLVIASQAAFWLVLDDASMMVLLVGGAVVLTIAAMILLSPSPKGVDGPGLRSLWNSDRTPADSPIDTLRELRSGYLAALMMAVLSLAVVPAIGLYLNALPIVEEAALRQALVRSGSEIERRIALVNGDLRRTALPGMGAVGRYPSAPLLAAQLDSPGAPWSLTTDATRDACQPLPNQRPSLVLRLVWTALAGLLPGQSSTFREIEREDRYCRLPDRSLVYRHPLRFGGIARIVDPLPAPGAPRLMAIASGGAGPVGSTVALLATLAALVGLLALLRLVARRVLGLDTPVMPGAPTLGAEPRSPLARLLHSGAATGAEWCYVRLGTDGTLPGVTAEEPAAPPPRVESIDLMKPARARFGAMPEPAPDALVLHRLTRAVLTPSTRLAALERIERALRDGPALCVLTAQTPPWARLCTPGEFPDDDALPDAAEALRWRAVRARLAVHRADHDAAVATLAPMPAIADPVLCRQVADERIALQELIGRVHPPLDRVLAAGPRLRDLKDFEQLALPLVEPQFRREWSHCSIAERMVLQQLALGLLPNPLNRAVLDDLLLRRLVVLAPEPRIVCATFRTFVLRAEKPEQYLAWREAEVASPWQRVRTPFFVTLLLLVAWFAYSFRDAFSTLDAVLAGTLGLFASIGKATTLVRGVQGGDGK